MKQQLLVVLMLSFITLCVSSLTFSLTSTCYCIQYNQNECTTNNTQGQCNWNAQTKLCQEASCQTFTNSQDCLVNYDKCKWNGTYCSDFSSCTDFNGSANLTCNQQNLQCIGTNGTCLPLTYLPSCNNYTTNQCGQTNYEYGYGGTICVEENSICTAAQSCQQIPNQSLCDQQKFSCQWNNGTCVQQQCSQFTTASNCSFVFLNMSSQNIQTCTFQNGTCQPFQNMNQLGQNNCSEQTFYNYHWVQENSTNTTNTTTTGKCLPCSLLSLNFNQQLNYYSPNNECPCYYFTSQSTCNQANKCNWINYSCQEIKCSMITDQLACISNINCEWDDRCQDFQNCDRFQTTSKYGCLLHSFNCKAFNSYSQKCLTQTEILCNSYPYLYNYYYCQQDTSGMCYFNFYSDTCEQIISCNQIQSQGYCNLYSYTCIWNGKCQQFKCQDILRQENCKFIVVNMYTNDIEPCYWNSVTKQCYSLTSQQNLTQQNCQENTLSTFYWAGTQCLRCFEVTLFQFSPLTLPDQCLCSQIYTSYECEQTRQCLWFNEVCIPTSCNAYSTQAQCKSNPQCMWQNYHCNYFTSCSVLYGNNQQECLSQSINCPASNGQYCEGEKFLTSSCENYKYSSECVFSLSKEGLCFYNTDLNVCQLVTDCSYIQHQKYCLYANHQCIWINNQCQAVSCSAYKSQSTCTFYTNSFYQFQAIPCMWNSSKNVCVQAPNDNYFTYLSSVTCYQNTDRSARWLPVINECVTCKRVGIPNVQQCSCSQLMSEINCQQSQQCKWNKNTSSCEQVPCNNLSQQQCVMNSQCMWLKKKCAIFTSCSQLIASNIEDCLAQSLYCPIFNYQTKECQSQGLYQYLQCQDYSDPTSCSKQHPYYSCYWDNQNKICKFFNFCIGMSYNQCLSNPLCTFNTYNGCQYKECVDYTTKRECTFVLNFESVQTFQSCIWQNNMCMKMSSNSKYDPETCFTNTDQTSRWSSNSASGYCLSCLSTFHPIKPLNQCICSQLLNQNECLKAGCGWNQNYCETQCSNIIAQQMCINTIGCFWNLDSNGCYSLPLGIPGDICQTLRGQNSLECLSQTLECPVSLNGVCQDKSHLSTCQSYSNIQACQNSVGQEGYCNYENQQCQVLSSCTQVSQKHCNQLYKTCQWISGTCTKLFCSSNQSSADCDYVYQSVNSRMIQLCQWNQTKGLCESVTYALNKTQQNCYSSTGGLYHWSSNNQQNGYCITCQINLIQPQRKCACNLLSEIECQIANPQCRWTSDSCVQSECTTIYDSINCSKQLKCMWSAGQCLDFTNCTNLSGSNSFECLAQSSQCGFSNGTNCQASSSLQTCDKQYSTISTCIFGVKGSDGFCVWNSKSSTCSLLISCNQITVPTQCQSLMSTCKWSTYFNNCVPFECQDYLSEESCTHVNVNLQDTGVELCEWRNEVCQPYDGKYFRYDEEICFQHSEQTYRWVGDDKQGVKCQQCSDSFKIMFLIIHLLIQVLI